MKLALLFVGLVVLATITGCTVSDTVVDDNPQITDGANNHSVEDFEDELETQFIPEDDFVEIGELI